jgi:ribonuclease HII
MTKKQREVVYERMLPAFDFGEGWVSATEIDFYGLSKALTIGASRALRAIDAEVNEEIIVDGNVNYLPKKYKNTSSEVRGEYWLPTIAAASVYAKVKRDWYMEKIALKYPAYYFEQNVGYGTKLHAHALKSYGAIERLHRFSFAPIANLKAKK